MRTLSGIRLRVDQMLQLGRVAAGGPQRRSANLLQQFFGCRRIVRSISIGCRRGRGAAMQKRARAWSSILPKFGNEYSPATSANAAQA